MNTEDLLRKAADEAEFYGDDKRTKDAFFNGAVWMKRELYREIICLRERIAKLEQQSPTSG